MRGINALFVGSKMNEILTISTKQDVPYIKRKVLNSDLPVAECLICVYIAHVMQKEIRSTIIAEKLKITVKNTSISTVLPKHFGILDEETAQTGCTILSQI